MNTQNPRRGNGEGLNVNLAGDVHSSTTNLSNDQIAQRAADLAGEFDHLRTLSDLLDDVAAEYDDMDRRAGWSRVVTLADMIRRTAKGGMDAAGVIEANARYLVDGRC